MNTRIALLGLAALALGGLAPAPAPQSVAVPPEPFPAPVFVQPELSTGPFPFSEADVPVALLVDVGSGKTLYARNPDRRFPPASVTKTMTALVAFDLIKAGKLHEHQSLVMSQAAFRDWRRKGSTMFISAGEAVPVAALLTGIMNVSANDGSAVLAEGAAGSLTGWTGLMNARARQLGMRNSHFATPNGWPDEGATFVSASDLVRLGEALFFDHPDLYRRYVGLPGMTWHGIAQPNHDPLLGKLPGADGIKTGFTDEARYNYLGTIERDGRRLMLVIGGARDGRTRAKAARALAEWGYAAWQSRPLVGAGNRVGSALVQDGDARSVSLVVPRRFSVSYPAGQQPPSVTTRIVYRGPLKAPIARGTQVATLEVRAPGQPVARLPLEAGESVRHAGPVDRLVNGIAGLVR